MLSDLRVSASSKEANLTQKSTAWAHATDEDSTRVSALIPHRCGHQTRTGGTNAGGKVELVDEDFDRTLRSYDEQE